MPSLSLDILVQGSRILLPLLLLAGRVGAEVAPPTQEPKVSFNFQIRPILANNCYACHGPDEKRRKAKLRLDVSEQATSKGAIKPGDPDASEVIKRLTSTDPDEVMPPPDSHKTLSDAEKLLLRQWIAQGAHYETHWAFVPPVKPDLKNLSPESGSPIDVIVQSRLKRENIQPSPPTTKERWLRRVTLDLTGLPPTIAELDAFLSDTSDQACESVVDRLLGDKAYGERMAQDWLDAARYSDTYGRHEDADSPVWRYRDWVVGAFNANLPYDQFLIWQTAGDLLPNPTQDQYIATAFNRLVQQSNEAGSNEEEFRISHVVDRLKTNATTILGLTLECARCHDHKYDPLTMRDFYGFSAFLNNIDELGLFSRQTAGIPAPSLLIFTPEQQSKKQMLTAQVEAAEKEVLAARESAKGRFGAWCKANGAPTAAQPVTYYDFDNVASKRPGARKAFKNRMHTEDSPATSRQTPEMLEGKSGAAFHFVNDNTIEMPPEVGAFRRSDTFSIAFWFQPMIEQERAVLVHRTRGGLDAASRGYEIVLNQMKLEFSLAHFAPGNSIRIRSKSPLPINTWTHVTATYDGSSRAAGLRLFLDGKPAEIEVVRDSLYRDILYRKEWGDFDDGKLQDNGTPIIRTTLAWRYNDMGLKDGAMDEFMIFDKTLTAPEAAVLAGGKPPQAERGLWDKLWGTYTLPKGIEEWSDAWARDHDETLVKALARLHDLRTQLDDVVNDADEIMVMRDMEPRRATHVLTRGKFDQKGEEVTPQTPAVLPPMAADLPKNRLGLARWFVDRQNPLTARVAVNRIWQTFFGRGLVGTTEDFGIQGELPTHPELLDWLACEFMEHGWDVKRLCRMIVLSSTYRQSSMPADKTLLENDPQNKLLARGPRHRLGAEQIRDTALAVSGLLKRDLMGGPPVKPYQPENLYEDSGIQSHYDQDRGEKLWRRSLYTYLKRTMPPPNMLVFDAPTREFCRVRRERTNTPLQALALLNDPQFVETCRVLAEKEVGKYPDDVDARIIDSFRLWTARKPSAEEIAVMRKLIDDERTWFRAHPDEAKAFLHKNGEAVVNDALPAVEVAATAALERALLGDDETLLEQ